MRPGRRPESRDLIAALFTMTATLPLSLPQVPVSALVPLHAPPDANDQPTHELAGAVGDWIRLGHAALGAAALVDNPGMPADFSFDSAGLEILFRGPDDAHRLLGWTDQEGFVPEPVELFLDRVNRLPSDPWADAAYLSASRMVKVSGAAEVFLAEGSDVDRVPATPARARR